MMRTGFVDEWWPGEAERRWCWCRQWRRLIGRERDERKREERERGRRKLASV
jgi:hypothetical protein